MAAAQIDFWFTMGSTYSFLGVMRLAELERSTGIPFRWRPFHLLVILQEMKHVPFADKPTASAASANSARHRWIACRQRGSRALGVSSALCRP